MKSLVTDYIWVVKLSACSLVSDAADSGYHGDVALMFILPSGLTKGLLTGDGASRFFCCHLSVSASPPT